MSLIVLQIAITSEPNATVPKWYLKSICFTMFSIFELQFLISIFSYLKVLQTLIVIVKNGTSFL